ncbi:MAG: multiprotein bridging factor aMBF1 [Thermoplasmata archaeon]
MNCEMCGSPGHLTPVSIEGTLLNVCSKCAKYGTPVSKNEVAKYAPPSERVQKALESRAKKSQSKDVFSNAGEEELVSDFAERILRARQLKGWSQEEFAKKLNEKQSVISKIEGGDMVPPDELVKKIEKLLGIKLMEKPSYARVQTASTARGMTLGDFLIQAKKEKKK